MNVNFQSLAIILNVLRFIYWIFFVLILIEFKFDGFSAETCRSLIAILDDDRSGKLGYGEFKQLWNDLRMWKVWYTN